MNSILYARAADKGGFVSLPIIDVTNPAFDMDIDEVRQRLAEKQFMREGAGFEKLPVLVRRVMLRTFLRGSILLRGHIGTGKGAFLDGYSTYLLKLAPGVLEPRFSKPVDKRIAQGAPALSLRARVFDVASLIAASLPETGPIVLVDIAGGPAITPLNALLLAKDSLRGRKVEIRVLDIDEAGPAFGKRALEALAKGPLAGIDVSLEREFFDWKSRASVDGLRVMTDASVVSSEGGLFEYGTDEEILRVLDSIPKGTPVIGSVTRDDAFMRYLKNTASAKTIPRGLDVFRALVKRAGYDVARSIGRSMSDQVLLTSSAS